MLLRCRPRFSIDVGQSAIAQALQVKHTRASRILGFRFGICTVQKGFHISEAICCLRIVASH
jgi:hypothetical protein